MFRAHALPLAAAFLLAACADSTDPVAGVAVHDAPPAAIINGVPDWNNDWSAVGAIAYDRNGDGAIKGPERFCTGTLIAPDVLLSAGHCFWRMSASTRFGVSFDNDFNNDHHESAITPVYEVVNVVIHPQYRWAEGTNTHDMALVFLRPGTTAGMTQMRLPALGALDQMPLAGASFISVGYGLTGKGTGAHWSYWNWMRNVATSPFSVLTATGLRLQMNPTVTDEGGTCNGDSGGPTFLDADGMRDVVVGVAITGDYACRASGWSVRMDTPDARGFLGQFVTLP